MVRRNLSLELKYSTSTLPAPVVEEKEAHPMRPRPGYHVSWRNFVGFESYMNFSYMAP